RVDPPPPGTHVSPAGWGHRAPRPLGVRYRGVFYDATSGHTWVVGDLGLAARLVGNTWTTYHTGVSEQLNAVWAEPGAQKVWAVSDAGRVLLYDATADAWQFSYSTAGSLALHDVVGLAGNVYVAAAEGTIVQRHGVDWSLFSTGTPGDAYRAITAANGVVVALGMRGLMAVGTPSGTSTKWTTHAAAASAPDWVDVGSDGAKIWAVASSVSGRLYSAEVKPSSGADELANELAAAPVALANGVLRAVAVRAPDDIWVASNNRIWHSDGSTGKLVSLTDVDAAAHELDALAVKPSGALACGGAGYLIELSSAMPTAASLLTPGSREMLTAVDRNNSGGVIAVGDAGGIYIGTQMATTASSPLRGVWSAGPGDTWVVGSGQMKIGRFDGATVTRETSFAGGTAPSALWAVDGAGGQVWAVGAGIWSRDAASGTWSQEVSVDKGDVWRGIHVAGVRDVWVVGTQGKMVHYDGVQWETVDSGTTATLNDVWSSGTTVWVAGAGGHVARRADANSPWEQASLSTATYTAIEGAAPDRVWVVGSGGAIYAFDGATWTPQQSDTLSRLQGITVGSASDVTVVGEAGTILHYNDT
ncbi:MAG: hypothetical protein KC503_39880, partial [Myxococcales bacterium]|nr:hypothetical protein [Myxococcales bacterium]